MNTLEILLGASRVATLERFEDEQYVIAFDPGWLADPDRPVLGQFFEDRRPEDIVLWGPPSWFAHLLPQGPLRRAIARQANLDLGDVFELLQFLGEDLPGAVVLRPAESRLRRPPSSPLPATAPDGPLRFALAGAQWKLSVSPGERGLTLPVHGETGQWIAKLSDPVYRALPRVECATMTWAKTAGLVTPAFRQGAATEIVDLPAGIPVGDGTVYFVERFDRCADGMRVHMEDFGQIFDRPPGTRQYEGSYESIAAVLAAIAPVEDVQEFCARVVFCAMSGNTDAHLKNWSVVYPDRRHARLSPAYDLVASVLYTSTTEYPEPLDDELALELGGSRDFAAVDVDSFQRMAAAIDVSFAELSGWVRDAASRVRDAWERHSRAWAFSVEERALLQRHMARVRL